MNRGILDEVVSFLSGSVVVETGFDVILIQLQGMTLSLS